MSKQKTNFTLPKLWDDLSLRPYLGEIRRRHGIVETLALPSMRDLPPLRIETLFVSPLLAENLVSADRDPNLWPEGKSLFDELQISPQLVVLGDPGGGKTTLTNWLAWRLSAGLTTPLPAVLEERVPLPCVLREMSAMVFTANLDLPNLAEYLAEKLLGDKADDTLKASLRARVTAGDYVLILDGVDEISVPYRKIVANWVRKATEQNACVVATSRIVGYEDGPVDREVGVEGFPTEPLTGEALRLLMQKPTDVTTPNQIEDVQQLRFNLSESRDVTPWAQRRYLMPFDQERIAAFAENWYRQRCGTEHEARQKTVDLLDSLAKSEVTQQLARTPNLLSLMAIVHRERTHLPDGKAELYDEIANAYINTIDKQRKILPGDTLARYNWKEREAWLAYVAFQMQQRRGNQNDDDDERTEDGVLADQSEVENWLTQAMRISGVAEPENAATTFLAWVARRCGLLLPRGVGRYAFVHLSFQEYFSARYLNERIMSRAFIRHDLPEDAPVTKDKLAAWGKLPVWRETLVFLFELLSTGRDADWVEDLAEILFGSIEIDISLRGTQSELAARALSDRHVRLGQKWKDRLADRCSDDAYREWKYDFHRDGSVLSALVDAGYAVILGEPAEPSNEPTKRHDSHLPFRKIADFLEIKDKSRLRILILLDEGITDITPLAEYNNLRLLEIANTQVAGITSLAGLNNLQTLAINNTQVADITPLAGLNNLQTLELINTQVTDIKPLAGLNNLQSLNLSNSQVTDITPLAGLNNLQTLDLENTAVVDITLVGELNELKWLNLNKTKVADIAPVAGLINLNGINLNNTPVTDLTPLAKLTNLNWLTLNNTLVTDLTPLAELTKLNWLTLNNTPVTDVAPLAGLNTLFSINLNHSQVTDLTPLAGLINLNWLNLNNTPVADITPLAGLINLHRLELNDTPVADITPLAGLISLHWLHLNNTLIADITPLAGLINLHSLHLKDTAVKDIVPLAGLDKLKIEIN
jgi:internalin A